MKKSELASYIEKYHLGGIVESVLWEVDPKTNMATVQFVATENSTVGKVKFPFINIGTNPKFGIASTSSLLKMLSVMNEEIEMSTEVTHGINMGLLINDSVYNGKFSLADVHNLPEVPEVGEPKFYELTLDLDKDFKDQYLKAYKALGSINRITIEAKEKIKFTLGNKESYANKMSFEKESMKYIPIKPVSFSGEALAAILKCNDVEKGVLEVSEKGLLKISFHTDDYDVTYFIVELEDL